MMPSTRPSDPFAGLPAPQAAPSYQDVGKDRSSDALFSSLSIGKLLMQPQTSVVYFSGMVIIIQVQ